MQKIECRWAVVWHIECASFLIRRYQIVEFSSTQNDDVLQSKRGDLTSHMIRTMVRLLFGVWDLEVFGVSAEPSEVPEKCIGENTEASELRRGLGMEIVCRVCLWEQPSDEK